MRLRSPSRSSWLLLAGLLGGALGCGGCDEEIHRGYTGARERLAEISARTLDESCPEEPACAKILAALAAVPVRHPDHGEATALLARIAAARAEKVARATQLEAIRRDVAERLKQGGAGAAPRPGAAGADAPLPGADEVPAFLGERHAAPDGPAGDGDGDGTGTAPAPTGELGDGDGTGTAPAPTGEHGDDAEEDGPELPAGDGGSGGEAGSGDEALAPGASAARVVAALAAADAPGEPAPADSCAGIRAAIAKQEDFVKRAASDRDVFGTIEDEEDFHAMWLLRKLARCGEHPDDPDCRPLPAETTVDAATPDPRSITREPGELKARFDGKDAVIQDPGLVVLQRDLERCEAIARGPTR